MSDSTMSVDDGGGRQQRVPVDYPSNARRLRGVRTEPDPPPPKREKIITGEVVKRGPGFRKRFMTSLLGEGGIEGAVDTFVTDILVSAFKGMVSDAVSQASNFLRDGVDRALYGETRARRTVTTRPNTGYVNYTRMARPSAPAYNTISARGRASHDFGEIIVATRGEAQDVIDALQELIEQFDVATVADLYDLVGITGEFTDNDWGWHDLRSATVRHTRGGYLLVLPRTRPVE